MKCFSEPSHCLLLPYRMDNWARLPFCQYWPAIHVHTMYIGDVVISAVVSSYLLTHLHHVLQRAEYGANKEGRSSHAANFAQLRKVLCMDARSMKDASALGLKESDLDKCNESHDCETKAA